MVPKSLPPISAAAGSRPAGSTGAHLELHVADQAPGRLDATADLPEAQVRDRLRRADLEPEVEPLGVPAHECARGMDREPRFGGPEHVGRDVVLVLEAELPPEA